MARRHGRKDLRSPALVVIAEPSVRHHMEMIGGVNDRGATATRAPERYRPELEFYTCGYKSPRRAADGPPQNPRGWP